jgi:hypothetical protein
MMKVCDAVFAANNYCGIAYDGCGLGPAHMDLCNTPQQGYVCQTAGSCSLSAGGTGTFVSCTSKLCWITAQCELVGLSDGGGGYGYTYCCP